MNKVFLRFSTLLLFCACLVARLQAQDWFLVWSDEFNLPDGSPPDPTKWGYDTGGSGWGNNELEYYTSRTNNARIQGGALVIEALKENYGGRNYTSARLLTKAKWSWTYGRIEARIKIPRGQGLWPAFWMLGTNIDSVGWPTCGEIDIMENIGRETNMVHGTAHGPGYSGGNGIGGPFVLPGAAVADDFHLFAIEWQTNRIRWLIDNQPYFMVTPTSLPSGTQWVFNQPQFVILNVAVGGNWPGNPDGTTVFPQRMTVDYVRVYAATNATGCGGNALTNPGFEFSGLASWARYGANTQLANVTNGLPIHSGTNGFKVFGQFNGTDNYSGVYQDTPCSAGASYTANGWAITASGDKIAGQNTAWIEVSFRDSAANILGIYRTAIIASNTPAGVWLNLPLTNQLDTTTFAVIGSATNLIAPAGTAFVRYQAVFHQPASSGGSVVFDDLSLLAPGPAETPIPVTAARSNNSVNLAFPGYLGRNYQVWFKNDLNEQIWQVLTNVTGSGSINTVADNLGGAWRFYRVVCVCN